MINTLKGAAALLASFATVIFVEAAPAFSQAPTDAQRNAIRSECRSDYEAHCASVPPGGAASLQCLQQNMSSLSSSCQTAVRAVGAPAAPEADSAPAAAPAKPAAETTAPAAAPKAAAGTTKAKKPSGAQVAAIRSACRSDYQKVCAGVPTGGSAALSCLEKNKSKVSAPASKPSTRPAAALQRLPRMALRHLRRPPAREPPPPLRRRPRWYCGRCDRARSYWS
jgi:Cysteine rich repeat